MKTIGRYYLGMMLITLIIVVSGCSKGDNINLFSVNDDISLGIQVDGEIRANPQEFPILDSAQNVTAYAHLYRIRNTILASATEMSNKETFAWRCTIIDNDTVINAFCTPGGYMYFYTGLIKMLDNEAEFAGVMAHEMVHADRRHTTDQLTITYGLDLLVQLVLGNNHNELGQIAASLAGNLGLLAYSRSNEYVADRYAVRYLYPSEYDAASLRNFFVMMQNQPHPPVFLSTHPSPEDRLEKIDEEFLALGGVHGEFFEARYAEFKSLLP
ncbi:MAG: M48 family metalloprotease [Bacteroidales bacterium]|nr:M48 family metalloprotease [Bacteroidales bacterium]